MIGIIKDKEKLFEGIVEGANVIINLNKGEKLIKSIQTTSNNKGEYKGSF